VALMEAEHKHNESMAKIFPSFGLTSFVRMMQGPDKNTLLLGQIERRKKRIKEIDGLLTGSDSRLHPEP